MPPTPAELSWLLRASASGDDQAARAFVGATQPTITRVCRLFGGGFDVEDLVSETYLRAFACAASFDGLSSPMGWLVTIARRVCVDEVRRATRRRRLMHALPPGRAAGGDAVVLGQLIDQLPEERRDAFLLTAVAGFSYDEAAEILGCPIGTIRSRVARARAELTDAHRVSDAI